MGRRGKGRNNKQKQNAPGDQPVDDRDTNIVAPVAMSNAAFEEYYKLQGLMSEEEDWQAFLKSLASDLPTTFRVTGSRS